MLTIFTDQRGAPHPSSPLSPPAALSPGLPVLSGGRGTPQHPPESSSICHISNLRPGTVRFFEKTSARNIVATYTYDANHNLLTIAYSDDTPGVTNSYDAFSRLTQVVDGVGTHVYTYDANSRLISYDGPWANDTITYACDALGRQTNLIVQGGTVPLSYAYDPLNRMTGVTLGADVYAYTYSNANPIVQRLDRPNGSYTTYGYDGLNRLTGVSNRKSTQEIINQFLYSHNAQDLRSSETISNGLAYTYTTNQMVRYDYNRLNQLLTSAPPSQVFAYDADGNLTRGYTPSGYVFTATYDAENRLKTLAFTNFTGVVYSNTYLYAANSFLAEIKAFANGVLSNRARFVRDGYLPLQERDGNNNVTREMVWGLNMGGGIGGLLNLKQIGANYSYLYDGKGNVAALLNASQAAAATYGYDEFGVLLSTGGTLDQPYRFSTKPHDPQTGLADFGYRFYSPQLGRWLNRDPIGENGGVNLYGAFGSNPVNYSDPDGRWVDTLLDVASIGYDLYQLYNDPCNRGANLAALGLDVVGAVVPFATGLGAASRAARVVKNPGVKYIGKLDDLKGIPRSQTLLDDLPDLGSAKANYYQNSSVLRKALRDGYEIRDASAYRPNWFPDPTLLRPNRTVGQSFLGAERNILDNKGLMLDSSGTYVPR